MKVRVTLYVGGTTFEEVVHAEGHFSPLGSSGLQIQPGLACGICEPRACSFA